MEFTTKVPIQKSSNLINYDARIMTLGSCFAENMAAKFGYFKLAHSVNPFGIIFNPLSLEKLVWRMVNNEKFTENDVFFHNARWQSYDVHSDWSHVDKATLLETLNQNLEQAKTEISHASHIIITYGTSWVYRLKSSGETVANCHKVPQSEFTKHLLSADDIETSIQNTVASIREINPDCHFIFTVSPVRHIKDGFVENNVSKAHLLAAVYKALSDKPSALSYFPSYEILMDELRDYRFYAADLLHPGQTAIDYIWERFSQTQLDGNIFEIMEAVDAIQKSLQHKPFNPDSASHKKFLENLEQQIEKLSQQYPQIQF